MQKTLIFTMAAAVLAITACSDSSVTAPFHPTANDVAGSWNMAFDGVPGSGMSWSLADSNGTVTGTGQFHGEAGPFGALTINGNVASDTLRLNVVYHYDVGTFPSLHPDTAQFVGILVSHGEMIGSYTRFGSTGSLHMVRPAQ